MLYTPIALRALYMALADHESGTPRQWLYLELAAQQTAGGIVPPPARLGVWLLQHASPALAIAYLAALRLPGLAPYGFQLDSRSPYYARNGALLAAALLAVLTGLGSQNLTRQFVLLLILLLGSMAVALSVGIRARRAATYQKLAAEETALSLAPAEAALGLSGMLVAAGEPLDVAAAKVAAIRTSPDRALDRATLQQLGLGAPAGFFIHLVALRATLSFTAGLLAVSWPCWLTARPWQCLPALLGIGLTAFVFQSQQRKWPQSAARDTLLVALLGGAVWMLRHIHR